MYKIDDEFRPPGRVFVRATRETSDNSSSALDVPVRKSNLKSAITTNLDDRAIQFEHEVKHEKTIEALVTEYPSSRHYAHPHHSNNVPQLMDNNHASSELVVHTRGGPNLAVQSRHSYYENDPNVQKVVRNKRIATEVLGSSMETSHVAQEVPDGHRRLTTHMVRKITTMSRAEESAYPEGNVVHRETKQQFAYQSITDGGGPKKSKVTIKLSGRGDWS